MAKKQFFAIVDTETTINDTVADFAIIIVDRNGEIFNQCAILVRDHFDAMDLFYDKTNTGLWSRSGMEKRKANYMQMLDSGSRQLASVNAVNRWINQAIGKYNPTLTAYNIAFDKSKCANTGIDLTGFSNEFCLWGAAVGNICNRKQFRQFALDNHAFNSPTIHGNMTFQTNAEIVAAFVNGNFVKEPHTALEDARDFELPILRSIIRKKDWQSKIQPYNWKSFQVKDHYIAK
jgi:hypothetical protein